MSEWISISDAAKALDLSTARVRLLAASGALPAEKIGGRWLLDRAGVEGRRRRGAAGGRPFTPHNSWELLRLSSSGESADSRLRRALAVDGLVGLAPRLRNRASVSRYVGHPGEIGHVLSDDRFVVSGISAAGAVGLDLAAGKAADGYVRASDADDFLEEHVLSLAGSDGASVIVRAVPDSVWDDFLAGLPHAPEAAVALDLSEDADPRSSAAGDALLSRLDRAAR
jgi:excisionase family DNA binding protein